MSREHVSRTYGPLRTPKTLIPPGSVFGLGSLSIRHQLGNDKIRAYFREYAWNDPVDYLPHSGPASVFLQFGSKDHLRSQDLRAYERFSNPKQVDFYEAGHALNAAATRDRVLWLARRLRLLSINASALNRIPELR